MTFFEIKYSTRSFNIDDDGCRYNHQEDGGQSFVLQIYEKENILDRIDEHIRMLIDAKVSFYQSIGLPMGDIKFKLDSIQMLSGQPLCEDEMCPGCFYDSPGQKNHMIPPYGCLCNESPSESSVSSDDDDDDESSSSDEARKKPRR